MENIWISLKVTRQSLLETTDLAQMLSRTTWLGATSCFRSTANLLALLHSKRCKD